MNRVVRVRSVSTTTLPVLSPLYEVRNDDGTTRRNLSRKGEKPGDKGINLLFPKSNSLETPRNPDCRDLRYYY